MDTVLEYFTKTNKAITRSNPLETNHDSPKYNPNYDLNYNHPHHQLLADIDQYGYTQRHVYRNHLITIDREPTTKTWITEFMFSISELHLISQLKTEFGDYTFIKSPQTNEHQSSNIFLIIFGSNYREDYTTTCLAKPSDPTGKNYRTYPMFVREVDRIIDHLLSNEPKIETDTNLDSDPKHHQPLVNKNIYFC